MISLSGTQPIHNAVDSVATPVPKSLEASANWHATYLKGAFGFLGFGGDRVDRRIAEEVLRAISRLAIGASLQANDHLTNDEDVGVRCSCGNCNNCSTALNLRSNSTTKSIHAIAWWPTGAQETISGKFAS